MKSCTFLKKNCFKHTNSIGLLPVDLGVQVQSCPACVFAEEILSPSASVRGWIMKIFWMLDYIAHNLERRQEVGLTCELLLLQGDKSGPVCPAVNHFQKFLGHPDRLWGCSCVFPVPVEFRSGLEYKGPPALGIPQGIHHLGISHGGKQMHYHPQNVLDCPQSSNVNLLGLGFLSKTYWPLSPRHALPLPFWSVPTLDKYPPSCLQPEADMNELFLSLSPSGSYPLSGILSQGLIGSIRSP